MHESLHISLGQYSDRGRKDSNQDSLGACLPGEPGLGSKGIAIALADGISSSEVSREAADTAVKALLEDYYCTSDAWSVKTSVEHVLAATNSWLHAQTQQSQHRYERDRGYVCTFSGLILKSTTAHLFHVGDTRIYHWRGDTLTQLTTDHRLRLSAEEHYLARALGMDRRIDIDYRSQALEVGDCFFLLTDGVHEYLDQADFGAVLHAASLDQAARQLAELALARGSEDNLSVQIVRIDSLPSPESNEMYRQLSTLPFPPPLQARMLFDGYRIVRDIQTSARSHIFLAVDEESGERVVLKTPSVDQRDNPAYLERFLLEEWIARRIDSPHVLKPCRQTRRRNFLYIATEYIEGQTLAQWMTDNPRPDLATVRQLLEQVGRGLQAFHRLEMVHQDLKPDNIMIDVNGTVKIIDFGATRVAGVMEIATPIEQINLLGAAQYAAPEYFLGEAGSHASDLFSLGVIAYQMLAGRLPYGTAIPQARTRAAQRRLNYTSVLNEEREIPAWVDDALRRALAIDPQERYSEQSEFIYDLHHPNPQFLHQTRPPLLERHPAAFWKTVAAIELLLLLLQGAGSVLHRNETSARTPSVQKPGNSLPTPTVEHPRKRLSQGAPAHGM